MAKKKEEKKKPNPGSQEAIDLGCQCPILDNGYGKGSSYGADIFWINSECPIHGIPNTREKV